MSRQKKLKLYSCAVLIVAMIPLFAGCSFLSSPNSPCLEFSLVAEKHFGAIGKIKAASLSTCGKKLFITDGTLLGDSDTDFVVLSTADLGIEKTLKISRVMSYNYSWACNSIAMDCQGRGILFYNQYVSLKDYSTQMQLNIWEVIGRQNVCPEPLSISPNGRLALIIVDSYYDSSESCLALFDLASGKSIKIIKRGGQIDNGNACFLSDQQILIWSRDGSLFLCDVKSGGLELLPIKGPTPLYTGKNSCMEVLQNGSVLLSGGKEVMVLDITEPKIVCRWPSLGGNAVALEGGHYIMWQHRQEWPKQPSTRYPYLVFAVADVLRKEIVSEVRIKRDRYDLLMIDPHVEYLYGIQYDVIHKMKITNTGKAFTEGD